MRHTFDIALNELEQRTVITYVTIRKMEVRLTLVTNCCILKINQDLNIIKYYLWGFQLIIWNFHVTLFIKVIYEHS